MINLKKRDKIRSFSLTIGLTTLSFIIVAACTKGVAVAAKPNIVYKDKESGNPSAVAKIGNQYVTEEELIGSDKMDFFELKKREYELKMDRLNKLMVDTLIGAEAKKANMSTEEFINKKVVGGNIKVSDAEYKKFVEEKHIPESQINPQIKERINQYLQSSKKQEKINDYLAKLTKNNPVLVYFAKPKMEVKVDPGQAPWFGKQDAPVTIIEFSDFQCPFCSRAAETVDQLRKKYGNKIKLAFKQFPLPMHQDARPAAEASMCVNEQGTEKFWKFHDLAFKNQDKLDKANLEKLAKDSGADPKKFTECVDQKKYANYVQQDMEYGEKVGVRSTPTFFINGQLVSGAVPIEQFSEIIEEELSSAKK